MSRDNAARVEFAVGPGKFELCFEARLGWHGCANFRKHRFDPLNFGPPKLSNSGPLCHPLAVCGVFWTQFYPPSLVLAGNQERIAQLVALLFTKWGHQG